MCTFKRGTNIHPTHCRGVKRGRPSPIASRLRAANQKNQRQRNSHQQRAKPGKHPLAIHEQQWQPTFAITTRLRAVASDWSGRYGFTTRR